MQNNDVIRTLRYVLDFNDAAMIDVFARGGSTISALELAAILAREDEKNYCAASDALFESFLDGLILVKRGEKETKSDEKKILKPALTNNMILKKLRIAFDLREDDMIGVFKLGNVDISKSELTALFRKEGHKHFKGCGDQYLRNFLAGLALRFRKK
jgi:uncharacterized protein YehS (DUF1456 family)